MTTPVPGTNTVKRNTRLRRSKRYNVNALGKTAEGSKEIDLARKQVVQQTPPNIRCGE